jgi:hypothetical protein
MFATGMFVRFILYPGFGLLESMKAEGALRWTDEPLLDGEKMDLCGSVLDMIFRSRGFNSDNVLHERPSIYCVSDFSASPGSLIIPALTLRLQLISFVAFGLNFVPQSP